MKLIDLNKTYRIKDRHYTLNINEYITNQNIDIKTIFIIEDNNIDANININILVDNNADITIDITVNSTKVIHSNVNLNINCINIGNSKIVVFPKLETKSKYNILNHKVTIGSLTKEEIEYINTKGIKKKNIKKLLKERYNQ